jgi:hypothetical protein
VRLRDVHLDPAVRDAIIAIAREAVAARVRLAVRAEPDRKHHTSGLRFARAALGPDVERVEEFRGWAGLIQFSHQRAYASLDRSLLVMLPHQPLFDLPGQFDGSRTVAAANSGFELVNEFGECLHAWAAAWRACSRN